MNTDVEQPLRILVLLPIGLNLTACALPAFDDYRGIQCLLRFPWILLFPAWYANYFFVIGTIRLWNQDFERAMFNGITALFLGSTMLLPFWRDLWSLYNRGSYYSMIHSGFFFWQGSLGALAANAYLGACVTKQGEENS